MIPSFSTKFFVNQSKRKGDVYPIYIRIIIGRKKAEIATNFWLSLSEWDESKQRARRNTKINEELASIESEIYDIVKRLDRDGKPIDALSVKNILTKKEVIDVFLLAFFDSYIKRMTLNVSIKETSIIQYKATKKHITNFVKSKKVDDIRIDQVDYRFITDFDLFLMQQKAPGTKTPFERNTINKHQSNMATMFDNLYVVTWKGRLLEENHYYPYGLSFDTYKAPGVSRNNVKYNSQYIEQKEFTDNNGDDYGLDWYDFAARSYDPQIGRWMQPDPMMQHASPYLAMGDNPISFTDPLGLEDGIHPGGLQYTTSDGNGGVVVHWYDGPGWDEGYTDVFGYANAHGQSGGGQPFTPNEQRNWYKGNDPYNGTVWGTQLDTKKFYPNQGAGLNTANDWLGYAGHAEGGIGVIQLGMLDYRSSLSINSKIGTFGRFSSTYRTLGMTGKVLGGAGYLGAGLNTYLDYKSMKSGEIGAGRFGYRTAGTLGSIGGSIGIGLVYGGPWGAVGGAVIGGASWAGEKAYDGYMYWQTQMGIFLNNVENGLKNGWVPGR